MNKKWRENKYAPKNEKGETEGKNNGVCFRSGRVTRCQQQMVNVCVVKSTP
jgi:hypothetical protein